MIDAGRAPGAGAACDLFTRYMNTKNNVHEGDHGLLGACNKKERTRGDHGLLGACNACRASRSGGKT